MPADKPLRLRVFAGPNGSGKSTILRELVNYDIGHYVNADDIANDLRESHLDIAKFNLAIAPRKFKDIALDSGLINQDFPLDIFSKSYSLKKKYLQS